MTKCPEKTSEVPLSAGEVKIIRQILPQLVVWGVKRGFFFALVQYQLYAALGAAGRGLPNWASICFPHFSEFCGS